LAPSLALLIGADDAKGLEALKVPWGERRVLAFHMEQSLPEIGADLGR
jgi:hypothetical protein